MRSSCKKIAGPLFFTMLTCCIVNVLPAQEEIKGAEDKFEKMSLVGRQEDGNYIVPTSQIIDPAGITIVFPGRPVDLALNPNETILAVKNMSNIVFFDAASQDIRQTLSIPDDGGNTFTGIAWSDSGKKVWTTDTKGYLRSAKLQTDGTFAWNDAILLPAKNLSNGKFPWEDKALYKIKKTY